MGAGIGVAGLGGGIAKGLSRILLNNREIERDQANRDQSRKDQMFMSILPTLMQNATSVADLEPFLAGHFPEVFGEPGKPRKGKGPSAMDQIAPFLEPVLGGGQSSMPGATDRDPITGRPVEPTATPTATPQAQPNFSAETEQRTLFGVPVLSEEQKVSREVNKQVSISEGLMRRAETVILPTLRALDPDATIYDAMRILGVRADAPMDRTITPSKLFQDFLVKRAKELGREMTADEVMKARKDWESSGGASGAYRFGVDREAISKSVFGKNFGDLTPQEAAIVMREEKTMLEGESKARATGAGQGKFETPADLKTAQATGVPVGTSAADVKGQAVPTIAQADRRRSVEALQESLQHIKTLLGPLPKQDELAGLLPGAVYAMRRRSPEYRNQIAALESAVNNVVNVMARSVGEQRGTQTERDALRAEAAIVQIRDAIIEGDTQESAAIRIDESLRTLNNILGSIPATPTPTTAPKDAAPKTPAPAASPGGMTIGPDGKLYIDGKLVPGQK